MVDRYGDFRAANDVEHMALADDGMWVKYEDYRAVEAELAEEKTKCDEAHKRAGERWKELDAERQDHGITKRDLYALRIENAHLKDKLRGYVSVDSAAVATGE